MLIEGTVVSLSHLQIASPLLWLYHVKLRSIILSYGTNLISAVTIALLTSCNMIYYKMIYAFLQEPVSSRKTHAKISTQLTHPLVIIASFTRVKGGSKLDEQQVVPC